MTSPVLENTPFLQFVFEEQLDLHLTAVEDRLGKLEEFFAELFPGADLDVFLSAPRRTASASSEPSSSWGRTQEPEGEIPEGEHNAPIPESLPQAANGFDWSEGDMTKKCDTDGMAVLAVDPEGMGYLGNASNVVLMRSLHDKGWRFDSPSVASAPHEGAFVASKIHWNPLGQIALNRYLTTSLVDAYFLHYHTVYPIVHEASFRARYGEESPTTNDTAWSLLLRTILAIGAWCIGCQLTGPQDEDVLLTLDLVPAVFGCGNLCLVQALALLATYLHKKNRPNTAWNSLGLAIRVAISLGLHKEFPDWKISLLEREMRRRVWWTVYMFDSGLSGTFGRPIMLPQTDMIDIEQPLNVSDELLNVSTEDLPTELLEPTIYSNLRAQVQFHVLFNSIYNRQISRPGLTAIEVLRLDSEISEWVTKLPGYFQEEDRVESSQAWLRLARYRLFWRIRTNRISLFYPVLLQRASEHPAYSSNGSEPTEAEQAAFRTCLKYAHQTVLSVNEYFVHEDLHVLGEWYALSSIFQACLISIIAMLTDLGFADLDLWFADIQTTKHILLRVSGRIEQARKFLDVINRLCPEPADKEDDAMQNLLWEPGSWQGLHTDCMDVLNDKWPAFVG